MLLLFLFLLPSSLRAQHALILIQHDAAGPNLPTQDFVQAEWILWPAQQGEGINNRVLALATGVDLQGEIDDTDIRNVGGEAWLAKNVRRLRARGAFAAREAYLGDTPVSVVRNGRNTISRSVLLLGLSEPTGLVRTLASSGPLPDRGIVVYEAQSWDDVQAFATRVNGRTLVVEYPPNAEDRWSRFWLRGAWPRGVPTEGDVAVSGLIRARRALALLTRPDGFAWTPDDAGRWGGANRWLIHGRETGPYVLMGWFASVAFVLAWALAQVMNEDRGPFVSQVLIFAILSPAALVLAGAVSRATGLESWPVSLVLGFTGLYGLARLGGLFVERLLPDAHPLWASCVVGFAVLAIFDPLWSELSGRFGPLESDVSGEALGAFLGYLAGVASLGPSRWLGRAMLAGVLLSGVASRPWWIEGHANLLVLPAVVWIATEGLFRPAMLALLALLPTGLWTIVRHGGAFKPYGLLSFADEEPSLDLWRPVVFFVSPLWLATVGVLLLVGLFGNRFLAYRLRRLLRHDPRLRVLPWLSLATLALGTTEPLALSAAPILALGALLALAFDGLRANA